MTTRCKWVGEGDPLMIDYHDKEWGMPVYDDQLLFEMLLLEGAQAGLSWKTILHRREAYRAAFKGFDPKAVAAMTDEDLIDVLNTSHVIRHHLKIFSVRTNARVFLTIQNEVGTFSEYCWSFVKEAQIVREKGQTSLACSPVSTALSKDLKKRGMKFVGPTIMYAFMQAVGIVNDHDEVCFRKHPCTIPS